MKRRGRWKRRATSFNPNRDYVTSAVQEYLKLGGKITHLKAEDENFEIFITAKESGEAADQFLAGDWSS